MHGPTNIKSKSSVVVAYFLPGRTKDLSAPLYWELKLNLQNFSCDTLNTTSKTVCFEECFEVCNRRSIKTSF